MPVASGIHLMGTRKVGVAPLVNTEVKTVTLAQLNAGHKLVFGYGAVRLRVTGVRFRFNGTFTTGTDMRLSTDASTPIDLMTIAVAGMLTTEIHTDTDDQDSDITVAANMYATLAAGSGLQLRKTGSDMAGGTSIDVILRYQVVSGLQAA